MKIQRTKLARVYHIIPDVFEDDRGFFSETLGKHLDFHPVQANMSKSKKGVIRGLHYQKDTAKLVWVAKGKIFDVAMDPDTGDYVGFELSDKNHAMLLVPANFSHGFQSLEKDTVVCYLMDKFYDPKTEGGYSPLDIDWPLKRKIISKKDRNARKFPGESSGTFMVSE